MVRLAAMLLAVLLLAPALARASGDAVIKDCTHNGSLTKNYSQKDYQEALAKLPADVDEYGDCRQIIRDAQLGAASGGCNGTPAGSIPGISAAAATPKTPAERPRWRRRPRRATPRSRSRPAVGAATARAPATGPAASHSSPAPRPSTPAA